MSDISQISTSLPIHHRSLRLWGFATLSRKHWTGCHYSLLPNQNGIPDEMLHLAAAIKSCGFQSVVWTMWEMADTKGKTLPRASTSHYSLDKKKVYHTMSERLGHCGTAYRSCGESGELP